MNNPQIFEQEGFASNNPITSLPAQMPLPMEEGYTTISGMWEPEPIAFRPLSDEAGKEI